MNELLGFLDETEPRVVVGFDVMFDFVFDALPAMRVGVLDGRDEVAGLKGEVLERLLVVSFPEEVVEGFDVVAIVEHQLRKVHPQ